jgi:hypothetical protein
MTISPQKISADNCLRLGSGALFVLTGQPRAGRPLSIGLHALTCRESGPLLNWRLQAQAAQPGKIRIEAVECLYQSAGSDVALFEFLGEQVRSDWADLIELTGLDTMIPPKTVLATWMDRQSGKVTRLSDEKLNVEGVFAVPFTFKGELSEQPADSELRELNANVSRRSVELPGFKAP